ncbi:MAG: hypothetical protein ACREV5_03760 [Steroidobacter sp.]
MKTIDVIGHVDENHRLSARVPDEVAPGPVRLALVLSEDDVEDEAGGAWSAAIAREWASELADPRQDIYTMDDGEPADDAR